MQEKAVAVRELLSLVYQNTPMGLVGTLAVFPETDLIKSVSGKTAKVPTKPIGVF